MKIGLLGCKGTTLDLLDALRAAGVTMNWVITLSDALGESQRVAFFEAANVRAYCKAAGIPVHTTRSYNLRDEEDKAFFKTAGLDLLLVIGWERLVPDDILKGLSRGAFGMHGSPYGLPRGRGRSPMNWSLITGHKRFVTNLFRYAPGMDDGDILGTKAFDINEHDTIGTLHLKNRIAMTQLVLTYLPQLGNGTARTWPQPPDEPSFYPKRTPEDGVIDWRWSTETLHRFIRALSVPYPGAFAFLDGRRIVIMAAQPFDTALFPSSVAPGTILDVSRAGNNFTVKTADGSMLVTGFEGVACQDLKLGQCLSGGDQIAVLKDIATRYGEDVPDRQKEILPMLSDDTSYNEKK